MGEFVKVAQKSEIPEDTGKLVEVDGKEIGLFKVKGKVYALYNACIHVGGPLADGGVHGKSVMCPWHGWEFDLATGKCSFNESVKQPTFKVKEEGEDIYVEV